MSDTQNNNPRQSSDSSERTPLIRRVSESPIRVSSDVSIDPYNFKTVRSIRFLSYTIFVLSIIWMALVFVTLFYSLPLMYQRGSVFIPLGFAFVTVALIGFDLLFFTTSSKADKQMTQAIFFMLCANLIIVLVSSRLRHQQTWVGIITIVVSVLACAWTLMTGRAVAWARDEEAQRIFGRSIERQRKFFDYLQVTFSSILYFSLLLLVTLMTLTSLRRALDYRLKPLGHLVKVENGKYRVHIACTPRDSSLPVVLVEGGETSSEYFSEWISPLYHNNDIGQVCIWDRPGFAFSDNSPSPRSAGQIADVLSEVFAKQDVSLEKGMVLVSHGIGGIYSRIFAARHSDHVKSLMLVDTMPESLLSRISSATNMFYWFARGIFSPIDVNALIGWIFFLDSRRDRVWGKYSDVASRVIQARFQEGLVATHQTLPEIQTARTYLNKSTPILVVASGNNYHRDKEWRKGQEYLNTLSARPIGLKVVENADHNIWENSKGKDVLQAELKKLVHGQLVR